MKLRQHISEMLRGGIRFLVMSIFIWLLFSLQGFAQPSYLGTYCGGGAGNTFSSHILNDRGRFRQKRIVEDYTTSAGTRMWEFEADFYYNTWRAPSSVLINIAGHNIVIPPDVSTASAFWRFGSGNGGDGARLLATTNGYSYTFNIQENGYANSFMAVLESAYSPTTFVSLADATAPYGSRTATVTLAAPPSSGENVYIRYTTDDYATSTIIPVTFVGAVGTALVPVPSTYGVTQKYYAYSSPNTKAQIDAQVASYGQVAHDMLTLELSDGEENIFANQVVVTSTGGTLMHTYPTLKDAFDAINAGVNHTGTITIALIGNTTETVTATLNASGTGAPPSSYASIGIQPAGGVSRTISGTLTTPLINLNGADNVTIDGNYSGSGLYLLLRNTNATASTTGPTIQIINSANSGVITNCELENNSTSTTSGNIVILTGTNSVTISNNNIHDATGGTSGKPYNAIYSNTATNTLSITNNNIYNWSARGINAANLADGAIITGNSFYMTSNANSTQQISIDFLVAKNNHNISNNFIGGTLPNCGGSPWTNISDVTFKGMRLAVGTTTAASIQGNTIQNISLTSPVTGAGASTFQGIQVTAGLVNVGTVTGNVVGHVTAASSISITGTSTAATNAASNLIDVSASTTGSNVENNTLANFTYAGNGTISMYGIRLNGNARKNKIYNIGSTTAGSTPNIIGIGIKGVDGGECSNNFIAISGGSSTNPTIYGFYGDASTLATNYLYYNSVSITGPATTSSYTYSFYRNATSPYELKNNILANNRVTGGAGKHYAINLSSSGSLISNYNDLYTIDPTRLGFWLMGRSFSEWQSVSGQDANSINVPPVFNSSTDLHLNTLLNDAIDLKGTPLAAVTTDIDGTARDAATPDPGGDEFLSLSCAIVVGGTATGAATYCGSGTPAITASGYSTNGGTTYQWQYSTDNSTTFSDVAGQTNPAALSTGVVSVSTWYRLAVSCVAASTTDYSNVVAITINPAPASFIVTPVTANLMMGGIQQLEASGGDVTTPHLYPFGTQANQNTATWMPTDYPAPYSIYFGGQRMQMLIRASELTAAGFSAGSTITNIQFPVVSLGSGWGTTVTSCESFKVKIGETALSTIASFQSGLTTVYSAANFTPAVGYANAHPFSTPFSWNGTSNIILETTFSNSGVRNSTCTVTQYNSPTNSPTVWQSTIVYRADGQSPATVAAATGVDYSYNARPDFKLSGQTVTAATITWSPTATLFTNPAATVPYTGTNEATVYAKPTTTTTYTATATAANGCTATGTATITTGPVEVIGSIPPTDMWYPTVKAAFDDINLGVHKGSIDVLIHGSTTETATATLNASGAPSSYTDITIYPAVTGVSVTGSLNAALIDLNGADNVTLDGRVNAIGSTKDLTVINTSTGGSASTIMFRNDANSNKVRYCKIQGASTKPEGGVVFFATAAGSGNNSNVIAYNDMSGTATNRPYNIVYSNGLVANNTGDTIRNNNVFNFINGLETSIGVKVREFSSNWTISDNSFYETTSLTTTSFQSSYCAIWISNSNGDGFIISGNFIGGNAPSGNGIWTQTNETNYFFGIYFDVPSSTTSIIRANTIRNFIWTNGGGEEFWTGILINKGVVTVGGALAADGNMIGDSNVTGSILATAGDLDAFVYGIRSASPDEIIVEHNAVGGIIAANTNSSDNTSLYGIYIAYPTLTNSVTVRNNLVGSHGQMQSMLANSLSSGIGNVQEVIGIHVESFTGTSAVCNNTVANLENNSENSLSIINGIRTIDGIDTIRGNIIHDLSNHGGIRNDNFSSVIGINSSIVLDYYKIAENTIYNLNFIGGSSIGPVTVTGIYFSATIPAFTPGLVERNFIHTLNNSSINPGTEIRGIDARSKGVDYQNNIVSLKLISFGGGKAYGFLVTNNGQNNLYYNTVSISGEHNTGADYGLFSEENIGNTQNNIFANTCTGTAIHKAIELILCPGIDDYNDYMGVSTVIGPNTHSLFNYDPQFTAVGGTNAADYKPLADALLGDKNVPINTDYFDSTRCFPTMGAIEMPAPLNVQIIAGRDTVCPGETVTYSIPDVPYATNYAWTVPALWTITSTPPYSYAITVVAGPAGANGNITVTVTKGSCLPPDTGTLPVTVVALPVTGPIYHD